MTIDNLFPFVVSVMESVEQVPGIDGSNKKSIVKFIVTSIVNDMKSDNSSIKAAIKYFIDSGLLDCIIDGIVSLTKNGCLINVGDGKKCKCCMM